MAKTYKVNGTVRFVNRIMVALNRLGIAPPGTYILTVVGRKTGKPYSTPVTLVEKDDRRWLVAPYGEVAWVKNARAAGEVRLSHGRQTEVFKIHELGPRESAPVLKEYLTRVGLVRPYFDANPASPLEAFENEAPKHPVFLLEPG